jgi:hypothetical protein
MRWPVFIYGLSCAIVQLLFSHVAGAVPPVVFPPSQNWYVAQFAIAREWE